MIMLQNIECRLNSKSSQSVSQIEIEKIMNTH